MQSQEKNEKFLGDETSHLSAIGALLYLVNNIQSDIYFIVRLLARFISLQQEDIEKVLNIYLDIFGNNWYMIVLF